MIAAISEFKVRIKRKPKQGYKTQTMMTLVMGVAAMIGIFIMSLFF